MKDCLIVGGGISALLAAGELHRAGLKIQLIDKARSVGGRMATRRLALTPAQPDGENASPSEIVPIDFGAQFFTGRFPEFTAHVREWIAAGVASEWHRGADGRHPRYRGVPDMKSIPEHLAAPLLQAGVIQLQERARSVDLLDSGADGWRVSCESGEVYTGRSLLLTAPVPQCIALFENGSGVSPDIRADLAERFQYRPCFALMLVYEGAPDNAPQIPAPGYANDQEHPELTGPRIRWMADNRQKGLSPERVALTVHASCDFTEAELESDPQRVHDLLTESCPILKGKQPMQWQLHRWLYSEPRRTGSERLDPAFYTASEAPPLFLAGDVFGGGRVEGAAISGLAAAGALGAALRHSS
ncbi:MAG: FAD-dependent oxidoreductase [bacterium]|nr:FAD-dependent oxidoreductase [bacterium]